MKNSQRERIIKLHHHSIWLYGHNHRALYWESREEQLLRFEVLLGCGVKSGDSVLDVGCGFADLYHYMCGKKLDVDYTGIDLSPDMIAAAKGRAPELKLLQGDLFDVDLPEKSYDWVFLSGALNEQLNDDGAYVRAMLPRLYSSCRKGLVFNLLSDEYEWSEQALYSLQPYNPVEIMELLNRFSALTHCRADYMDVDVSYFVWKEKRYKTFI